MLAKDECSDRNRSGRDRHDDLDIDGNLHRHADCVGHAAPVRPDRSGKHLPKEGDGWRIVDRLATGVTEIGALEAIEVVYEKEGTEYYLYIVVFGSAGEAMRTAADWAKVGWQVVVTKRNILFAVTTETLTVTAAPEAPPEVPGTPVPETTDLAVGLLARSPTLSETYIDSNTV